VLVRIPAAAHGSLEAYVTRPLIGHPDLRVVIGHCTNKQFRQVFRVLTTLGWLGLAALLRFWQQGGVAVAEFWELDGVLVAEMHWVEATLACHASRIVVVATDNVLFVASMAVPVVVGTDLVMQVSDSYAACARKGHVGAFSWS
jgi:hypothetical protein